jgi:ribose transport system substrate-binding protein
MKIYMKNVCKVLLCFFIAFIIGCSGGKDNYTYKIGFVISTLNNPFFVKLKEGATEEARIKNVKLIVLDSQNDAIKELNNVESLVVSKVDLIIINPTDSDAVVSAIKLANDNKIPVITVDRNASKGHVVSYIASDNIQGGRLAASLIYELLNGKGKVAEIEGIPGTSAARERGQGFNEALSKYPNIQNVVRQPADFDRNKALNVVENILQVHPDINAIFAHNDEMALGALKAVEDSGKNIYVVGFDGTEEALMAVKLGNLTATIAQQPTKMGRIAVDTAVKYLSGEPVEPEVKVDLLVIK